MRVVQYSMTVFQFCCRTDHKMALVQMGSVEEAVMALIVSITALSFHLLVIVIFKCLRHHSKGRSRVPAYSWSLCRIRGSCQGRCGLGLVSGICLIWLGRQASGGEVSHPQCRGHICSLYKIWIPFTFVIVIEHLYSATHFLDKCVYMAKLFNRQCSFFV